MLSCKISIYALAQSWLVIWLRATSMLFDTVPINHHSSTKLLWRSPPALIQFYSPSTPAHKWCKPIRAALFISPLRAISLHKVGQKSTTFFFFLFSSYLTDLTPLSPPIQQFHYIHVENLKNKNILFYMDEKQHFFGVFMGSNLWSTGQCGSGLREKCL